MQLDCKKKEKDMRLKRNARILFFCWNIADVLMPEAYQHLNFHLQVFSSCFTSVTRESYPKLDKYLKPLAINGTIHTKL